MKKKAWTGAALMILAVTVLLPAVSAHAVERELQSVEAEGFEVAFRTKPEFPVTGERTEMLFKIHREEGHGEGLDVEAVVEENRILAENVEHDTYRVTHRFEGAGNKTVNLRVKDKNIGTFHVDVDTLGREGWLGIGVLILFAAVLLRLMYDDLKR